MSWAPVTGLQVLIPRIQELRWLVRLRRCHRMLGAGRSRHDSTNPLGVADEGPQRRELLAATTVDDDVCVGGPIDFLRWMIAFSNGWWTFC